jgi:uncharacterized protein
MKISVEYIAIGLLAILPLQTIGQLPEPADHHTVRVVGVFTTKEKPAIIEMNMTVNYQNLSYRVTSDSLVIIAQGVRDHFVRNGVNRESISISEILVQENYVFDSGNRTQYGYMGTARIWIRDDFSREFAGVIFRTVGSLDHEVEYSVRFSLSEDQKEELRKAALERAIQDAFDKAGIIAGASNVELVKIHRINFEEEGMAVPFMDDANLAFEESLSAKREFSDSPLDLNPKEISISRSIAIEWIIQEK